MDARLRRVNKEIAGASLPPLPWAVCAALRLSSQSLTLGNILACADCKNDSTSRIAIDLVDNSPYHLKGSFLGPEDTPYEGGHFDVVRPISPPPYNLCSLRDDPRTS